MQYYQPYSGGGGGGRHTTYHSNRHRTRSATSYNPTYYPNYHHQYFPSHQGINPPPSKRRRAEPSTWHPDILPPQIGEGSSSRATSRAKEEEPGFMSRDEIERFSPSRKDGIDSATEARLRHSYCSYLKNLGLRLALPQTTVATAIVLCHRFYLRRSHAFHDRFLVATAALFLASKSEETPCLLNTVLRASFEVSQNPEFAFMPYMIHCQNWFDQYRERVIEVEQQILTTLDFELEVKHPYGTLSSGLNKLGFSRTALYNMAWNLVTEGYVYLLLFWVDIFMRTVFIA
ncbi:Cyclin family protein [Rhynchospora pubera]|uniref:Cyclin family protein n=1 Tax=Rhynchospora pubera TaxID=906938 RepID=A0AAV8DC17_9POAL|nr:Cyclin family protein [Rhynchospora pubera]